MIQWNKKSYVAIRIAKKYDGNLKKGFANTYNVSYCDINKFILLLEKCVYPYEYMDNWENFNEISLPEKENSYSYLNKEVITDVG